MGLYKGLLPTLAKVAPAVSISYVVGRFRQWGHPALTYPSQVYEHSKRALHIS